MDENSGNHALPYQGIQLAQGIGAGGPLVTLTLEEIERQREYAARSLRQDALRTALEMAHGTSSATDWDNIVKAARVFLAFIENG
jgi:hypothetical protein